MTDLTQLEPVVRAIVHETLADMLGVNAASVKQRQWYKGAEAAQRLELDTTDTLHDLRLSGDLKESVHWRDISSRDSKRPTYQYHVGNCRKFLESRRN